jgi:hypothetical protein
MTQFAEADSPPLVQEFRRAMEELEDLYQSSGVEVTRSHPELINDSPREFVNRMLDLHRGLLLKLYGGLYPLERRRSPADYALARELFEHVWGQRLDDNRLKRALEKLVTDESELRWDALVGPFERLRPLRDRIGKLQTLVMRIANLMAKADGRITSKEARHLQWVQAELRHNLELIPLEEPAPGEVARVAGRYAVDTVVAEAKEVRDDWELNDAPELDVQPASSDELLQDALAELEGLIGLDAIKREVNGLVNFLKIQAERKRFGLPETKISLHSIFQGNPGTGKTTVARLFGRILGAMGILAKGHLVETDRSGLVAEYAGQTGPKANRRIDEALDGVLFIDEAYSLVAEKGDDPYGAEAVQTLLKRMEDNRDRLVVIIAGYPKKMGKLLRTNPGLSSRFSRTFDFPDYTASELGWIFEGMCRTSAYELPSATRAKLLLGYQHLLSVKNEHFGNGRLARNTFERAIGRLANRIADVAPLTRELLTTLEHADVLMEGVPPEAWTDPESAERRFRGACPGCQADLSLPAVALGRNVQCKRCGRQFCFAWGDPAV